MLASNALRFLRWQQATTACHRGIFSTAAAASNQTPTYTYASPGTSMSEPGYAAGEQQQQQQAGDGAHASAAELPASKVKPAAKRAMLRVLSGNKRKLSAQDAGPQMLPPGCSISDPKYSVSTGDPVYFVDHNAGSGGAAAGKH